jgi:hypothetical protein
VRRKSGSVVVWGGFVSVSVSGGGGGGVMVVVWVAAGNAGCGLTDGVSAVCQVDSTGTEMLDLELM